MRKIGLVAVLLSVIVNSVCMGQVAGIPVDSNVRIGKLENGLTYYIRHNEEPKDQANFYIAQKVGSILEEENQRGLAHFLEHMCFNGTVHFPGNGVVKYCESIGVQFGGDLNAYTSIDETVYNIDNVPMSVPHALDSCLWILHDWADGLLLNGDDIDKERGVIREEWRSRRNATTRMYEQLLPKAYPGNKYGERMPIGLIEVIENFSYQELRDYYERWYRPDQQGIVVVGDIDVDIVEEKIKEIFSTIEPIQNPAERYYLEIEDNIDPIICMAKDREQKYAQTYIFLKHDAIPLEMKSTMPYYIISAMNNLLASMFANRMEELAQLPEPPFIQARVADDDYLLSKTKGALAGVVVSDEESFTTSVSTLYREMLRALRNGFTASEFDRASAELLAYVESAYKQREKKQSASYCQEYVRHFIDNEPIPGIEFEYSMLQQLFQSISVEHVNSYLRDLVSETDNMVVFCMLPDKEGVVYPSEIELESILEQVRAEVIEPYTDDFIDEPLIDELPTAGSVVKTSTSIEGYKKFTLSNGAKLYLKSTDFNADEILFEAYSKGGLSLYSMDEALNLKVASDLISIGGLGKFKSTDLNKVLAGKQLAIGRSIGTYSESVAGNTTPKDLETFMQLIYLSFTSFRMDNDAFESWKNRAKALLKNDAEVPMSVFNDSLSSSMYDYHPLVTKLKMEQVDLIDYDRVMQIASERFANASDFSFVFTGNISEEQLIPLAELYIASLPSTGEREKSKNIRPLSKSAKEIVFQKSMQQPMATVVYTDNTKMRYNQKNRLLISVAAQILDIVYTEEIREKEGGTYGVSTSGSLLYSPSGRAMLRIVYQTDPSKYETLNERIEQILSEAANGDVSSENLQKVRDYMLKNHDDGLRQNDLFHSTMVNYIATGVNMNDGYRKEMERLSTDMVAKTIKKIIKSKSRIKIVMYDK